VLLCVALATVASACGRTVNMAPASSQTRVMVFFAAAAATVGLVWLKLDEHKAWQRKMRNQKQQQQQQQQQGNDGLAQLDAVGGHGSKKDKGPPILMRGSQILKPFQAAQPGKGKSRGELEADFYKQVTDEDMPLRKLIPAYYGVEEIDGSSYLVMENLTHGLKEPCVLDLKMGQQTYDETATPAKIEREKKKYPPQEAIGFRIVGMRVARPFSGEEPWKATREWCMSITEESMQNAIEQYFFDGRVVRFGLVEQLIHKLQDIAQTLRSFAKWRMYGSSLLVVYDAAAERPTIRVRMIDFAHIFPIKDGGVDHGYLHGVAFLESCLRTTLSRRHQQVGGAHGNISAINGELIKVEDKPDQFDTEVAFYRKVWGDGTSPDPLSNVMPRLIRVNEDASPRELVISDATRLVSQGYETVSVMDIKLGVRSFRANCENDPKESYFTKFTTFEQDLSPGRAEELWKQICGSKDGPRCLRNGKLGKRDYLAFRDATTTSHELGFRLTALVHGDYRVSQNDSRSLETKTQFLECLEHYLCNEQGFDMGVATQFVDELKAVSLALSKSEVYHQHELVGTSLLFLHCNGKAAIRWIDFANSMPSEGGDDNGISDGVHRMSLAVQELIGKYSA